MTSALVPDNASATQLIDAGLMLGRRQFARMIRAALPALFVAAVLELVANAFSSGALTGLLAFVGLLAVWGVGEAMAIAACFEHLHGRPAEPPNIWPLVSRRLGAILVGYSFKWLLIFVGLFLFIAPGVYLIALYFAVPTTMVAENKPLGPAFRRSRGLSRPGMKRIVVTLGLLELLGITLSILLSISLVGDTGEHPTVLGFLAAWFLAVVFLPFRAALMTLLYLERRVQREGYDLELAIAAGSGAA